MYSLSYSALSNGTVITWQVADGSHEHVVRGLQPGAVYQVNITAISYGEMSTATSRNVSLGLNIYICVLLLRFLHI